MQTTEISPLEIGEYRIIKADDDTGAVVYVERFPPRIGLLAVNAPALPSFAVKTAFMRAGMPGFQSLVGESATEADAVALAEVTPLPTA